ncbi:MAG: hypothetical protein WC719_02330 [Patescibacteria group bacterium]|jgi:hypothetical protein
MKKFVVLLAMVAIVASNAFGQTKQESRQINALEKEIKKTFKEIDVLTKDSLTIHRADTYHLTYVRNEISRKKQQIADLQKYRDNLFLSFTLTREVPKEASRREIKLRQRGNYLRRQELVIEKVEANLSSVDPSNLSATKGGYKVIVANDYVMTVTFIITSIDGGENKTVVIDPFKKINIYLVPGKYSVATLNGSSQSCADSQITINGSTHVFKGEECFNFIYMPRF